MSGPTSDSEVFGNIINGQIRHAERKTRGVDPRNLAPLWPVSVASPKDLDDAVAAAKIAFGEWSKTSIEVRQKALEALAEELKAHKKTLAEILSKEIGKSIMLGELEVEHSLDYLRFNSTQSLSDEVAFEDELVRITTTHVPLGVVGAICPWNFPLVLAMAKIAAVLVTGNCIIVKPSPFTPYSTIKFAELSLNVLPPGVLQVLNGDNDIGEYMTLHPDIQKITFTGSTKTGKSIMANCAKTLKRITLELGGNDASIILPDVDVEKVAAQVATGCFFNAGQMCVATKRVYIHESIYESFREHFVATVRAMPLAIDPALPSFIGPLQNKIQYSIVQGLIDDSRKNGYAFALGQDGSTSEGYFIEPCVIDNPPDSSRVVQEEQFGPIIPLLPWKTEDELIQRVNDTQSGLGASLWAQDVEQADRIGRQLEVGTIWLNSFPKPLPMGYLSGHKESGIGGEWGKKGLLSYCNIQSIHTYKQS